MAHGLRASRNQRTSREYWSRRPYSGWSLSSETKRLTCRQERRVIFKQQIIEGLADGASFTGSAFFFAHASHPVTNNFNTRKIISNVNT